MLIGLLLLFVVLPCTLIGYLVGHPLWGLGIGLALAVFLGWGASAPNRLPR